MKKIAFRAALIGVLVLAGCSPHHHATPPAAPPASPTPANPSAVGTTPSTSPSTVSPHQVTIYTVDLTQGTDSGNYLVPQTITLKDPKDPAAEAVRALIDAPNSPIPAGTKLNGIKIADGLATVDFSRAPIDENGGEEKQSQALEALQRTLGQFPDVSRIQITVNGQPQASLGEAAGGPMDTIRPGQTPTETGGA